MLLAALATSGSNSSQLLGSYKATQTSGDNMFLLSLMSLREAVQRVQNEQASLLEAHGIPKFGDTLPENTAMTGDICMASIPSEAAYMPAVDVSQLSGGID